MRRRGSSVGRPPPLGGLGAGNNPFAQHTTPSSRNQTMKQNSSLKEEALDLFQALGGDVVPAEETPSRRAEGRGNIQLQTMVDLFRTFDLSTEVLESTLPLKAQTPGRQQTLDFDDFFRFYRALLKQKVGFGGGSTAPSLCATLPTTAVAVTGSGGGPPARRDSKQLGDHVMSDEDDDDQNLGSPTSPADDSLAASASEGTGKLTRPSKSFRTLVASNKSFKKSMSSSNLARDRTRTIGDFLFEDDDFGAADAGPWGSLHQKVGAYNTDVVSAINQDPILQKAMAYGGIGATRQNKSTKFSKQFQQNLFPANRSKKGKYSTAQVEEVVRVQEDLPSYKRGTRKPKTSVAFAGLIPFPNVSASIGNASRSASPAGKEKTTAPSPSGNLNSSDDEGGQQYGHQQPRSMGSSPLGTYASPHPQGRAIKRSPPIWKMPERSSGVLPAVKDVYKAHARATPLDGLAQTPSFQLPVMEKMVLSRGLSRLGKAGGGLTGGGDGTKLGVGSGIGSGAPDSGTNPFHNTKLQSIAQRTLRLMPPLQDHIRY